MTISILGQGKFGSFLKDTFLPILLQGEEYTILSYDIQENNPTKLKQVISHADVVIPCIPIRTLEKSLNKIKSYVRPHAIIWDVCSIKVYSERVVRSIFPTNPLFITHPMFGPGSYAASGGNMHGFRFVLCNHPTAHIAKLILSKLQKQKIQIIELSSKEHDKLSAYTGQFPSLLLGYLASQQLDFKNNTLDTRTTDFMKDIARIVKDDRMIIEDIVMYNPFAQKVCTTLSRKLTSITKQKKVD